MGVFILWPTTEFCSERCSTQRTAVKGSKSYRCLTYWKIRIALKHFKVNILKPQMISSMYVFNVVLKSTVP